MFKRIALSIFLTLSLGMMMPDRAQALVLDDGSLSDAATFSNYDVNSDPGTLVGGLIKVVIGLLGIIFLVLTVYAGFTWMTAAGDPKKVDKAKGILTTSVVGLVIVLAAYTITDFVIQSLLGAIEGPGM